MTLLRTLAIALMGLMLMAGPAAAVTVRISVNDQPITDIQISARAQLLALENRGSSNGARSEMAANELIDEALMMGEAQRLGITVTDSEVNDAYLSVARNLRVSADNLDRILTENGVSVDTLKARLRAAIAWSGVTQRAIRPRVQISDLDLEQQAAAQVTESLSYDYILQEIIFIGENTARRTEEANQYRRNFNGCEGAVQLSLSYTDAAVLDVGRRHATQLPDAIAQELAGLNVGGITQPRTVSMGVSMYAVCSKDSARDLTFLKNDLMQETGTELLAAEVDVYLEELRGRASIVRL